QVNAAAALAQETRRGAESAIFRGKSQAAAYATSQRLQAEAEAAAFLVRLHQYRQLSAANPAYLNVLWLDEMSRLFARMREAGRIDLLDHYLTGDGLSLTQFPSLPRKK
ncbi:MAG: hypothetical protein NZO58_11265, partial [Gemmataceae bacterium]|nr:hypothetical protein [Gemmataceae bacterium]